MNVSGNAPDVIIALMIGELKYQPTLNFITTQIVQKAVEVWRSHPLALMVCEAEPMTRFAASLGVPPSRLLTALPQTTGHTTYQVALWLRKMSTLYDHKSLLAITHLLHVQRAKQIFARCKIQVHFTGLDIPFSLQDKDWKLRSALNFRMYNLAAGVYCRLQSWI